MIPSSATIASVPNVYTGQGISRAATAPRRGAVGGRVHRDGGRHHPRLTAVGSACLPGETGVTNGCAPFCLPDRVLDTNTGLCLPVPPPPPPGSPMSVTRLTGLRALLYRARSRWATIEGVYDKVPFHSHDSDAHEPGDVGSRIDPVLARSWLLVNGAHVDRFEAAVRSRADIVVLDIEDAVAPKDKVLARDNVVRWLGAGNSDWVRINGFGTPWWADDLAALAGTSVGGVMLAMAESVDHVSETANRLPGVPIVALVETARGLERITEIAAAKGTFRLAFGIGDFRRDTGFGDSPATLAYARSRITIAAKAAHLPSAIDGPTIGSSALRLIEATAVSAEFGMTGKICLSPEQCSVVNEGLSPSHDEIAWANEFFAEFEHDGGEIRNGSDLPRIARANKILDLARAYGIVATEFEDESVHMPAPSDTYHY